MELAGVGGAAAGSDMEADLDLLPTKEEVVKHVGEEEDAGSRTMDVCGGDGLCVCLFLGCLLSQLHAKVSLGEQIC